MFQDKLEAKLEFSQAELGKAKAELEKVHGDSSSRYNDYNDWRQKLTKTELEIDRLRYFLKIFDLKSKRLNDY
jgi:hypothetical protein